VSSQAQKQAESRQEGVCYHSKEVALFLLKPLFLLGRFLVSQPKDGGHPAERVIIRLGIPLLLAGSLFAAIKIAEDVTEVPSIAFKNEFVFIAQLVLLIFYSVLLLVVPLIRAVASGELPVELTLKGPRYQEKVLSAASDQLRGRVEEIEQLAEKREEARKKDDRATAKGIKANAIGLKEVAEKVAQLDSEISDQRDLTSGGIEALAKELQKLGEKD
jgi:hypothetical protein